MKRLVVLIGVRQPGGGLDELKSIKKCLEDMRDWALRQRIPRGDIKIFTDIPSLIEAGDPPKLSISDIYDWIDARAKDPQPADQLLIYFSGHGMQSGGATLWLLPKAPERAWEAVNFDASKELATWSRFKHVVFIGDCCATVADNVQFDRVRGASILQNTPDVARIKAQVVDYLLAARPGKASLEVTINGVSLSPYTVQLIQALGGTPTTILETQTPGVSTPLVLRVRKLADELQTSVNAFLWANNVVPLGPPFDNVVSTTQWVSLFPTLPLPPQPPVQVSPPPAQAHIPTDIMSFVFGPDARYSAPPPTPLPSADQDVSPVNELTSNLDVRLRQIAAGSLVAMAGDDWSSKIPDGYHYETQCGFYVTGASVLNATSRPDVECGVISSHEVRINPESTELVAIEFEGGGGVMIPAIPQQIGFIHVENGRLASLAYEPSGHSDVTQKSAFRLEFVPKSQRIRNLRDTLMNVVTGGNLSFTDIDPKTLLDVVDDLSYGGKIDFSTLLYLAYVAYASKRAKRALVPLANYMQSKFGFVPFDLKILLLLARLDPGDDLQFAPPFPLLTLGWSLLQATNEYLPEELKDISEHYRNTTWTHLDTEGIEICQSYLSRQTKSGTSGLGIKTPTGIAIDSSLQPTHRTPDQVWYADTAVVVEQDNEDCLIETVVEVNIE